MVAAGRIAQSTVAPAPADVLAARRQALRDQLVALTTASDLVGDSAACLQRLRDYLLDDDHVVALQADRAPAAVRVPEPAALTRELAALAERRLAREQPTLPGLLSRLPAAETDWLLAAAARIAAHSDLTPALL